MKLSQVRAKFPSIAMKEHVSMRSHTTFHCIGEAGAWLQPSSPTELCELVKFFHASGWTWKKDWDVIGNGSNLLMRDGGFRGVLISLQDAAFSGLNTLEIASKKVRLYAGAGLLNGKLLAWARAKSLTGFEFAFGIPGTVGGGVRMNAGTPQGWFSNILRKIHWINLFGIQEEVTVCEDDFTYRNFPIAKDKIIVGAEIELNVSEKDTVEASIATAKQKRAGQPLELPNFGSVFKNPKDSFAGQLIEKAGLKGLRRGDAQISDKHANFIVNLGQAKTTDALYLISKAQEEVARMFQISMEPEVIIIGEDL